jgi:hypothetical protein
MKPRKKMMGDDLFDSLCYAHFQDECARDEKERKAENVLTMHKAFVY